MKMVPEKYLKESNRALKVLVKQVRENISDLNFDWASQDFSSRDTGEIVVRRGRLNKLRLAVEKAEAILAWDEQ